MKYIECPGVYTGNEKSLFMAGGISNCPDWQLGLASLLENEKIVLINPRRKNFNGNSEEQIKWEHHHLEKADAVSFWFPQETQCPITLYELGKQSAGKKPIFIGIHPNYCRKIDVEIQTKLERPEVKIVYSLKDLAEQIKKWI